jgi:hypothetical protein
MNTVVIVENEGERFSVWLDYLEEFDPHYGADADGRRGTPVYFYEVLRTDPTVPQWAQDEAAERFLSNPERYV